MTLQPGTRLGGVPIESVLARSAHGVIYRVCDQAGKLERMEEIELPPGFGEEERARVESAVRSLQGPGLPAELHLAFWHQHAYLAYPEMEGCWLETRLRWSDQPVSPAQLQSWLLEVVRLVERLLLEENPLAGACLRPESWFLRSDGHLVLANLGLERLIWGPSLPPSMGDFARLLASWTGGSTELATAFVWIQARCGSEHPERAYRDFTSLREALEAHPQIQEGQAEFRTGKPVLESFVVPRLPPRLVRVTPLVLGALSGLLLGGLLLWSWLSRPPTPRAGAAVVVSTGNRLELLDPTTGRTLTGTRLAGEPQALAAGSGRLYLAVKSQLVMLDDRTLQPVGGRLQTDGPVAQLGVSPEGDWLYAWLRERGELMVFRLPEQATFLVPLAHRGVWPAPGPVRGKPGALLVDPDGKRVEALDLASGRCLDQAVLAVSGPAVADGQEGWWVASGTELVHLDAGLRERGRRPMQARVLGFSEGLVLLEGGLARLDQPDCRGGLDGTPVAAAWDAEGCCWVALRGPDQLLRLSPDLSQVRLRLQKTGGQLLTLPDQLEAP